MSRSTSLSSGPLELHESTAKLLQQASSIRSAENVRQLVSLTATEPPAKASLDAQQWSDLIERVRLAAQHLRQTEADAQEQERRVQELLDQVREDIANANARVKAAEARAREAEARAEASIRVAETRAAAAEERADAAEEWLVRVQEAITREFAIPSDPN